MRDIILSNKLFQRFLSRNDHRELVLWLKNEDELYEDLKGQRARIT